MTRHVHDRRVRAKYEKRKRTLLKKLWEFYTFCNVEFHVLMVNGTEATVVGAGNYQLPAEEILGSEFTIERLNVADLQRTYGRNIAQPRRDPIGSELDMEDSADDLDMECSTDETDLEDLAEENNIWDIVVPEPPT